DGAPDPPAAAAPGRCPTLAVPAWTHDHVVAVAQAGDALETYHIAGSAADEAIGFGDSATCSRAAVAPGHRPTLAVPHWTHDHVVTVRQGRDAMIASGHMVIGADAEEAHALGDTAADTRAAVTPGRRPAPVVPDWTSAHVFPVAQ